MNKKLRKNKKMPVGASLVLAHLRRDYHKTLNNTSKSGITLIALILTIIILLILAMVSISYIMRENIIKHAETAVNQYQIEAEKEAIELAYEEYVMDGLNDKNAGLNMEGQATVTDHQDEDGNNNGWNVKFENSGNEYIVDKYRNITGPGSGTGTGPEPEPGSGSGSGSATPTEGNKIHLGDSVNNLEFNDLSKLEIANDVKMQEIVILSGNTSYAILIENDSIINGNGKGVCVGLNILENGSNYNSYYYFSDGDFRKSMSENENYDYWFNSESNKTDWLKEMFISSSDPNPGNYPFSGTIVGILDEENKKYALDDSCPQTNKIFIEEFRSEFGLSRRSKH